MKSNNTVEPLSNDHPHQWPSLLYNHILCDGECFLFVRSLTDDHPSDATNDRVRWDFLPRERPPRLRCISKNHDGGSTSIPNGGLLQCCAYLWHLSSNSIALNFYFGDDATTRFSDRRCMVSMLPAQAAGAQDTFLVGLIQVIWTSRIRGAVIINGCATCIFPGCYKILIQEYWHICKWSK